MKRILAGLVLLTFIGASFTAATVPVSPAYAAENEVIATPALSSSPQYVAVTPDGSYVYASLTGSKTVAVIRTSDNTVSYITAGLGTNPTGLAVTPDGAHVYVANENNDNVSVIQTSDNTVIATVTVGDGPQTVAVNPAGTRVYVTNYIADTVSVIDTTVTPNTVTTVTVGDGPTGIAVTPDGAHVYVTNQIDDTVSVIQTSDNTVVGSAISVGNGPQSVAVNSAGTRAYVANYDAMSVSVIELVAASASASASGSPGVPGVFLAVNAVLLGKQVEGAPVYYGADRVAVKSTYLLTVTSVSNVSPSVVTLAEGTIDTNGSFSSVVRLPNLAPGTYNVRMTGEHTNGATLELTSQVTIDAGVFTSIGANIPVIR